MNGSSGSSGCVSAERQQVVERDAETLLRVLPEKRPHQSRRKAVEARRDRGVGREDVSSARGGQRHVEGLAGVIHEASGALQDRERRVAFVQVADFGLELERSQQPPSANPQQHLLAQPQLGSAPVQLTGDAADGRRVRRVVAVEQIQRHPADPGLPGPEPDLVLPVSGRRGAAARRSESVPE